MLDNMHANNLETTTARCGALSDVSEWGIFESSNSNNRGIATLYEGNVKNPRAVEVWPLDRFNLDIKLMKIDVEGMELNVLRGAEKTLEGVEHLFVEIPPNAEAHEEMGYFLFNRNFVERQAFVDEQIYYFRKER